MNSEIDNKIGRMALHQKSGFLVTPDDIHKKGREKLGRAHRILVRGVTFLVG